MRRIPRRSPPARQRGLAMLVLLTLFALAAAYLLVSSLNKSSTQLSLARAQKNQDVMQQAKAALIAWAASETLQGSNFQPGRLPCPDLNNNGNAESTCTTPASQLGRLPYNTLGIAPLYDASGELLWYAVSDKFRTGNSVINSDTQGTLTISGLTPASNVVAVVLAPGAPLNTPVPQDRSPTGTACNSSSQPCNTASNYLENINGVPNTTNYIAAVENTTNPSLSPYPFNDQLLAITQNDLFAQVEPMVAGWIKNDIIGNYIYNSDPTLTDSAKQWSDNASNRNKSRYFDAWGGFPFAAKFANPSFPSSFLGTVGNYEGLLPVTNSFTYTWSSGSVVQTGGSGTVWNGSTCSPTNSNTRLSCNIWYIWGAPTIAISGTVPNVGRSFVQLTRLSDVSCSGCSLSSRTLSGSLDSAGNGIVNLAATLNSVGGGWTNVTVTIKNSNLISSPLISSTDPYAGWLTANNWHRHIYYAVSPGYAPGGAGTCNSTSPKCLTVNNLGSSPNNNKGAILILTGSWLGPPSNANPLPSSSVTDYLEAQNAITAQNIVTGNYTYQTVLGTVSDTGVTINDRVIVIAP